MVLSEEFIEEKNKEKNQPIMLYEVELSDVLTLKLAEWDVDVEYPTGGGIIYTPFPLSHEGISMNLLGEVDAVKVTMGNVNREIGATIISGNGLIGKQVTMKLVFADLLDDPIAHIDHVFWIDSVEITEKTAEFNLTTKLDLYDVKLPCRLYERNHCQWIFKQEGCWLWSGSAWTEPSGFINGDVQCDHTRKGEHGCEYHANQKRFGGFPGIPLRSIYTI